MKVCKNCGVSLRWVMLKALMEDAGAKVYPSALYCDGKQEHEFIEQKEKTNAAV